MRTLQSSVLCLAVLASATAWVGCSKAPPDDAIKMAIADSLKRQVPVSWAGSLLGGRNANVQLVEIRQIGKFQKESGYWPVKARVKGTCEVDLITKREVREFDRVGDFVLSQDDYGNWVASIEMIQ